MAVSVSGRGLVGLDAPLATLSKIAGEYDGNSLFMVLVVGPPGSGRTTLVLSALSSLNYAVHVASPSESALRETQKALSFCSTKGTVDALLFGASPSAARARRAVFLDDNLPDAKAVAFAYDAMRAGRCKVLVVACVTRSAGAAAARRRAGAVVLVDYPRAADLARWIAERDPWVSREAARRCVRAAERCVPKALSLVEGEKSGSIAARLMPCPGSTL